MTPGDAVTLRATLEAVWWRHERHAKKDVILRQVATWWASCGVCRQTLVGDNTSVMRHCPLRRVVNTWNQTYGHTAVVLLEIIYCASHYVYELEDIVVSTIDYFQHPHRPKTQHYCQLACHTPFQSVPMFSFNQSLSFWPTLYLHDIVTEFR